MNRGSCEILNAVPVTLSPEQAESFLCHHLHRGLVQAAVYDICTQQSGNEEIQQRRDGEGPPEDNTSHPEPPAQARPRGVMPTLDWP